MNMTYLQFLSKLLPFVLAECRNVQIDEFCSKFGELVIEANGVEAPVLDRGLLVLGIGLPSIGQHHLIVRSPNSHPNHAIAAF